MKKMGYILIYLSFFLVFSGVFLLKPIKYSYTNLGSNKLDRSLNTNLVNQIDDVQLRKEAEEKEREKQREMQIASNATKNSGDLIEFNISGDSVLSGKVSYYSLHCSGCGGNLGSGAALDGVFYNDPTYGYVRAMACGREYPYGTVVSISGTPLGDFNGICLDRGGMIGTSKKRVFDILVNSNEEAYQYGISNITYNVIRNGY